MQKVSLETWHFHYNETHNELRLLVNSFNSKNAVLFAITPKNVYDFIEKVDNPDTTELVLTGQPMKGDIDYALSPEDMECPDAYIRPLYELREDDVSAGFNGEPHEYVLVFGPGERAMFAASMFDEPSLDHMTLQADMEA